MHQSVTPADLSEESEINSVLLRLAETIAGHTRLDSLLPLIVELTSAALGCQGCLLSLWDDSQALFVPAAACGLPERWERLFWSLPIAPGSIPLVDEIVRRRGPVTTPVQGPLIPPSLQHAAPGPDWMLLGVPLIHHNQVIGGIVVVSGEESLGQRQAALITGIARQTALAVASARAFESESRRRHDLETLQETVALLTTELDLETLYQRIVERAALTFRAPAAALFLWEPLREALPPVAAHGLSADYIQQQRIPTDLLRNMLQVQPDLRPFAVPELALDPLGDSDAIRHEHLQGALVIPVQRGSHLLGLVQVYTRTQSALFDGDALALAQAFANQTAIALENAALYRQAQERSRHLSEVLAAGRELQINQDTAAILQRIANGIRDGLGWRVVLITRYDYAAGLAYAVAAAGLPEEALVRFRRPQPLARRIKLYQHPQFQISRSYFIPEERGGDLIARLLNTWTAPLDHYARLRAVEEETLPRLSAALPVLWDEVRFSATLKTPPQSSLARDLEQLWRPYDALIIPIEPQEGETWGTISVDLPHHGRRPNLGDIQALEIFADQAAIAWKNARLYRIERRRGTELSALAEIAAAFGALTDLGETYRRVTASVTQLLDAEKCVIVRFGPDMQRAWAEHPASGMDASEITRWRFPVTPELMGLIHSSHGQAHLANDLSALPAPLAGPLEQSGFHNALLAFFARRGQVTGMLVVGNRPAGFGQDEAGLLVTVAHQAAIAIENAQLYTILREERERLRALSNRLTQAQEAERTRIARELHDEAGQALTTVRLQLDFVASALPDDLPAPVRRQVEEAKTLISHTLQEIRRISIDLRPSLLDDLGLASALRWHCERLRRHAQMDVVFQAPPRTRRLPSDVETAVYRAAQEALTNVVRHAQARSVQVKLDYHHGHLCLTIADDGTGFAGDQAPGMGLGLMGMRERLSAVGGSLRVDSTPGGGSTLFIQVPTQDALGQE